MRIAIIPRELGSLAFDFLPVRDLTPYDRENLIAVVNVTWEQYEVLCGQRDEYEQMQYTLEQLVPNDEPVQEITQT